MQTRMQRGYWFGPTGELRTCVILRVNGETKVLDLESHLYVDVRPEDVLPMGDEPETIE